MVFFPFFLSVLSFFFKCNFSLLVMHLRDCTFWAVFGNLLLLCCQWVCCVYMCMCVCRTLNYFFCIYVSVKSVYVVAVWRYRTKAFSKFIFRPKVSKIKLLERAGVVRYSTICCQVCNWQFRYSGAPPGVGCSAAKCCVDCVDCFVVVCGFCSVVCSFFFILNIQKLTR